MLDRLETYTDILFESEVSSTGGWIRSEPRAVHRLHVRMLVEQARPDCDVEYTTDVLMGALSAQVFVDQRRIRELPLERLKDGYADLVNRLMIAPPVS
jgi:hypothetical protein